MLFRLQDINSRRVIWKIFQSKDLHFVKGRRKLAGQLRGAVLVDGRGSSLPHQWTIVAVGGLGVCDGAHRLFVMKRVGPGEI